MVQISRLRELYWPVKRFLQVGFDVERNILLLKRASSRISVCERSIESGLKFTAKSMKEVDEILKAIAENGGHYKGRRFSVEQVEEIRQLIDQSNICAQKESENLCQMKASFEKLFNESCEHLDEVLYKIFFKGWRALLQFIFWELVEKGSFASDNAFFD